MTDTADQHLARLVDPQTARRLRDLGFEWTALDANVGAAARFRRRVANGPLWVGLVGGASSGKSTIFNSMIGREISRSSACAHETLGPVAASGNPLRIGEWIREGLLFPALEAQELPNGEATIGAVGALTISTQPVSELGERVLVDTPDVTSHMSATEGAVTHAMLPWFDAIITVVDEERWFDATVFDDTAELARELGAALWIVFNSTSRDTTLSESDHARLREHAAHRQAAGHTLCVFEEGTGYRPIADHSRQELLDWVSRLMAQDRVYGLETRLRRRCAELLSDNVARASHHDTLRSNIDKTLRGLSDEASLTADLLTPGEWEHLGLGSRFVPLYNAYRFVRDRIRRWRRPLQRDVDFEKDTTALAQVLQSNLQQRFDHATARLDRLISESDYCTQEAWDGQWRLPTFDAAEWADRIRAHIDAWKSEATQQSRRGDVAALVLGTPLLLADMMFLGGAGFTMTWSALSLAGFIGGKSLTRLMAGSRAFAEYQTTVRAYQSLIREALQEQAARNLERLPMRHLTMTDPVAEALLYWSSPARR